jgi:hypothetical protein
VTLASADPMGAVLNGFIRITGYMKKSQPKRRFEKLNHNEARDIYDDGHRILDSPTKLGKTFYFALTYDKGISEKLLPLPPLISGIVVEATGNVPDEYRRIGYFNHSCGDFDPDNIERHTSTII